MKTERVFFYFGIDWIKLTFESLVLQLKSFYGLLKFVHSFQQFAKLSPIEVQRALNWFNFW